MNGSSSYFKTFKKTTKKSLKIPKGIIRICKLKKNRQHNGQRKRTTEQITIYKEHT